MAILIGDFLSCVLFGSSGAPGELPYCSRPVLNAAYLRNLSSRERGDASSPMRTIESLYQVLLEMS